MIGSSADWRYARIQLDCSLNATVLIAMIGHELRHGVEIAGARAVVDAKSLKALYRRIGFPSDEDGHSFDSQAAVDTGLVILEQLNVGSVAAADAREVPLGR